MDNKPHSVIVLQGCKELPPQGWKARVIPSSAGTTFSASRCAGFRDPSRKAVLSVIVRDVGAQEEDKRGREERRLREAVLDMRSRVHALLTSGRLAALPVVLDVPYEAVASRGALNKLMRQRLQNVAGPALQEQQGVAAGDDKVGPQQQQQKGALARLPRQRIKVG